MTPPGVAPAQVRCARRWTVEGRVQGVGFRPFVYRLAHAHGLDGWVQNSGGVVHIHGEGSARALAGFEQDLIARAPPLARPRLAAAQPAACEDAAAGFRIIGSAAEASARIHVPPDQFACDDCLAEMRDPQARRHRYPFINCTQCGPRYTIIRAMPYDRPNTTMADFPLCADCAREYGDPLDRRFHAQPLACPVCGPRLRWRRGEERRVGNEPALAAATEALRRGAIVAVRGIGGYHLMCDATSESSVSALRARKRRPAKPLALMVPLAGADGLEAARRLVTLAPEQAAALQHPMRPIVLAPRRADAPVAHAVAPGLDEFGLMLPYSPLHHLLLEAHGAPLVATSGNISGEPVLTEPEEAEARLGGIADAFLHHDRPIQRPADDPVLQLNAGRMRPLRLGRGNGPLELELPRAVARPTLALGAFLKNTVALAWGRRAVVSPHIGDLHSLRSRAVLHQVAGELQQLYGVRAEALVHDAHPDFPNSRWALRSGLPARAVLHHHAHASALAADVAGDAPLLCFTWDGIGLGDDGTLWGGEAFHGRPGAWRRVASFRSFRLPGGERAVHEPWRTAYALCHGAGRPCPRGGVTKAIGHMLERGLASPRTSAVGRLFDGAAALCGLVTRASYEGEGPMRLEALCAGAATARTPVLALARDSDGIWRSDWAPLVGLMLDTHPPLAERAMAFHAALARALVAQAEAVRRELPFTRVGLTGGVFQNRVLTRLACEGLARAGFEPCLPERLPANDAGISYGQLVEAAALDGPS